MSSDQLQRSIYGLDHDSAGEARGGVPGKKPVTASLAARPQTNIIFRVDSAEAASAIFGPRDTNGVAVAADAAVDRAASSSGHALPEGLRGRFESSLGADLSSVRIHTGGESAEAASAVGAKAYTTGNDIHFNEGQYDPSSAFGVHLIAHEVAHTVQQAGSTPTRQHKLEVSAPQDSAEVEADRAADAMVAGTSVAVGSAMTTLARAPAAPAPAAKGDSKAAAELDPFVGVLEVASENATALHGAVVDNVQTCTVMLDVIGGGYATADAAYKTAYDKHVAIVTQANTPPEKGAADLVAEMVADAAFSALFPQASKVISILSTVATVATAAGGVKDAGAPTAPVPTPDSMMATHLKSLSNAYRDVGLTSGKASALHALSTDALKLCNEIEQVKDGKSTKSIDEIKKRAGELTTASEQAKGLRAPIASMQATLAKSSVQAMNPQNFDAKAHEKTIWMKWIANIPKESLDVTLRNTNSSIIRSYLSSEGIIAPDTLWDFDKKPAQIQADAEWALKAQSYLGKSGVASTDLDPSGAVDMGDATVQATRVGTDPICAGTTIEVVNVQVGGLGTCETQLPSGQGGGRAEPVTIYVRAVC